MSHLPSTRLGLLVLAAALGACSSAPRPEPPPRLRDVLAKTLESGGVDAAVAQYRTLRAEGFPGLRERASDLNSLGYRLLAKGDTEGAIRIFELNVEAHPQSADVFDSLGEAHRVAGHKAAAIENYEKAVARDPNMKTALAALQTLAGRPRSFPLMVLFHITAGIIGILSGTVAMFLRKGSPRHGLVGSVFAVSMLGMSASGAYRALVGPHREAINVLMGLFTFYLVATSWRTARLKNGQPGLFDWAALVWALAVGTGLVWLGLTDESLGPICLVFGALALLAAVLDLRLILRGGISSAARVARHLWRMITAFFIAVMSFFVGQPQIFPYALRKTGLLGVPGLLVALALLFWLIRVRFTSAYKKAAAPRPTLVAAAAGS